MDRAYQVPTRPPEAAERHVSVGESVVRGAIANFSAQPLTWGAALLLTTATPRLLGSDSLGQIAIVASVTMLWRTVLGLGIPDLLTRRVAQRPERIEQDVAVALIVQTVMALVGAIGLALLAPILAPALVDFRLLDIALVGMVATPAQTVLLCALRGREHHVRFAWLNALSVAVVTVGSVLVLVAGGDVLAYAASMVVLNICGTVLNWKVSGVRLAFPRPGLALVRESWTFIRGGFPFLSWAVTLTIYGTIDRVLLGAWVPAFEVGWYEAAYRIIGIAVVIPTALTTPLFPALSRNLHDPDMLRRAITQTLRIALLFTVPFAAGLIVVAPAIPSLFGWPQDFVNAVPLMMILSLSVPALAVDMVLGTAVTATGREASWVRVGLIAAVFNVLLNVPLIPFFQQNAGNGAIGASIVTVLTEFLMFAGAVVLLPKRLLDPRLLWVAVRITIAGAATAIVGVALLPFALVLAIAGGAIAYVIVAILLRVFTLQDLEYVKSRVLRHG